MPEVKARRNRLTTSAVDFRGNRLASMTPLSAMGLALALLVIVDIIAGGGIFKSRNNLQDLRTSDCKNESKGH